MLTDIHLVLSYPGHCDAHIPLLILLKNKCSIISGIHPYREAVSSTLPNPLVSAWYKEE
jgi:hypothetical protein